jgi:hypothetical protein
MWFEDFNVMYSLLMLSQKVSFLSSSGAKSFSSSNRSQFLIVCALHRTRFFRRLSLFGRFAFVLMYSPLFRCTSLSLQTKVTIALIITIVYPAMEYPTVVIKSKDKKEVLSLRYQTVLPTIQTKRKSQQLQPITSFLQSFRSIPLKQSPNIPIILRPH